jgi:tripeptide aminopeptidase
MRIAAISMLLLMLSSAVPPAQSPDARARAFLDSAAFRQVAAFIESDQDRFVRELVTLTEIPSPPFKEQARAKAFLAMLREQGLDAVEMDGVGNVMGIRRGTGGAPLMAVNAHLDTVFPEGTNVTVKRAGTRLMAPGIGDDTRGLALLLALIRTMDAAKIETPGDILFVGNVGEEGEGDLRGIKFLLGKGKYKDRIKQVVAIDGVGLDHVVRGGVGSRRYRVAFNGPGGHSYGAFGLVNPAFAMGNAMAKFSRIQVPPTPKTTFNIGVVAGGTSINSIPSQVTMDVDMRSESCAELKKLDDTFLGIVRDAAVEENRTRATREGPITVDPKLIGERPCGETPLAAPLVQAAAAALKAFGKTPEFSFGSTDANIPMSLGIPAITIGAGGPSGRAHAPDEWTDVEPANNVQNVRMALALVVAAAGAGGGR